MTLRQDLWNGQHFTARTAAAKSLGRVRDVMINHPKLVDAALTLSEAQHHFADEHVHMLLLVENSHFIGTLVRTDLRETAPTFPAASFSVLRGRCVHNGAYADDVLKQMIRLRIRRLAVINDDRNLVGLLCLKRSGSGFCSDLDVSSRASSVDSVR